MSLYHDLTMGLRTWISDYLRPAPDDLEIQWKEAPDVLHERKGDEIGSVREQASNLMDETQDYLEGLQEGLKDLESYDADNEQIRAIASSFAQARRRTIERFDPDTTEIIAHHDDLQTFITSFTDISEKQEAVFQQMKTESQSFSTALQGIIDHADTVDSFINNNHQLLDVEEQIDDFVSAIKDHNETIKDIQGKIADETIDDLQAQRDGVKDKIDAKRDSDAWERKCALEDEIDDLKAKRSKRKNDIRTAVKKLERGLKKLMYDVEHGNIALDADIRVLRSLREGDAFDVEEPYDELVEAEKTISSENLLSGRKLSTFSDAVDKLEQYESMNEEIETIAETIKSKEEELESRTISDEIEELQEKRDRLNKKIERLKSENEEKRDAIKNHRKQIEQTQDEIASTLSDVLHATVSIEEDKEKKP